MKERRFTISFGEEETDGRIYITIEYSGGSTLLQLTPNDYIAATQLWDSSDVMEIPELKGTNFRGFIKILTAWADNVDENRRS